MMTYRPEIDGLRALALLPVIFFHAGFPLFKGGFIGVDIFFVISGYLITSVILNEKQAGTFRLSHFYERRARRILPALYLVMLVCLPLAWFLMLPDDLDSFGQSLVATTVFANNILLWLTSGYWDLAVDFKPLLHTWSLGLEEQFYLIFPLFFLLLWRFFQKSLFLIFFLGAGLSLWIAHLSTPNHPIGTFFLLPARCWELLIGTLLALRMTRPLPQVFSGTKLFPQLMGILGLSAIIYAIFFFDAQTPHPSLYTLIPTLGTASILAYANAQTFPGKLLGAPVWVGLGLISYSAYLWHQPLLAFLRLASLEPPTMPLLALSIALTFLCAFFSWRFVEQPFRKAHFCSPRMFWSLASTISLFLMVAGLLIYLNSGFVHLWTELNQDIPDAGRRLNSMYNERPFQYKNLDFHDHDNRKNVLVIGDSFARDFINAAEENGYFSHHQLSYSDDWIPCQGNHFNAILHTQIQEANYLIFAFSEEVPTQCWSQELALFKTLSSATLLIIGPKNFGWNPNALMRISPTQRATYTAPVSKKVLDTDKELANELPSTCFVSLLTTIRDPQGRVPVFTENGKLISQDRRHLTKSGAKFIGALLFEDPRLQDLK